MADNKNEEQKEGVFIQYRNGRAVLVSQGAWEADWLRWWKNLERRSKQED